MENKMTAEKCSSCVKEPTDTINTARFIQKLDDYFSHNDLEGAGECLLYWEREARGLGDLRGLLTVRNEEIGFYRRTGEEDKGREAIVEAIELIQQLELEENLSGAVIYVNIATTLKAFGSAKEGMPYYEKADEIYRQQGKTHTYEYAALLNNQASAYQDLEMFQQAKTYYGRAITILKDLGTHDGEIAVSLINLAHATFDADDQSYEEVESLLDKAWEYLNSPRQPRDGNYAFILSKCAPSLEYFGRDMQARAARTVAEEIYEDTIGAEVL